VALITGGAQGLGKSIAIAMANEGAHIVICDIKEEARGRVVWAVAIAMANRMRVDDLARVPHSFPTKAGTPGRAASCTARQLNLDIGQQPNWPHKSGEVFGGDGIHER
jgi:NAD(P)-dependent dehydrogenase (short-subunit alcohol dehydrogenase family)